MHRYDLEYIKLLNRVMKILRIRMLIAIDTVNTSAKIERKSDERLEKKDILWKLFLIYIIIYSY
ncbi:MAG: hypothetical protein DSO07_11140 [Thermoproteota archaeon]|uniref:Uncharacterized protein n=1 Tax=Candidatus Methanodesulfokora washburnensis TaxID=2478471 RepID=A0A429GEE5_9CREN|nr:hypothetical protein D6D85_14780 [Candidatus Methanodesulfokores washburnensis]TDA38740.1 MAG: hypothetical protein DSO07_11140 [Candidatus Korarchaeota archaeon]